jgi:hypothetical protein
VKKWTPKCNPRITEFLDFVRRPLFYKLENTRFRKLDMFPPSGEGETPILLGPLEKASLNPLTAVSRPPHLKKETDSVFDMFL